MKLISEEFSRSAVNCTNRSTLFPWCCRRSKGITTNCGILNFEHSFLFLECSELLIFLFANKKDVNVSFDCYMQKLYRFKVLLVDYLKA